MTKIAALVTASMLALNTYVFYFMGSEEQIPARRSFDEFPLTLNDWRCDQRHFMDDRVLRVLDVTDYLLCGYRNASNPESLVDVYVGYHERQVREGANSSATGIHPPRHCLPGSGWNIIGSQVVSIGTDGYANESANRLIIARGDQRQLVYYWYQERGRVIASDYWKIVYLFWDRATRARSDGSLVRFTIPIRRNDEARADAEFRSLAAELVPRLAEFVAG